MLMILGIFLLGAAGDVSAQVYRCGNTYTHQPCEGGKKVDASPAVSDVGGANTVVLYLCNVPESSRHQTDGYAYWWMPQPCSTRGWTIERTERVPAGLPFEKQAEIAKRQQAEAWRSTQPLPQVYSNAPQQPSRKEQCAAYDAEVARLDAMGRAGSLHYSLEWVRERRREVRDAQFRLRC